MNAKIEKIQSELPKIKDKIAKLQARQKELERQLVETQNADIVAAVRAIDVKPEELQALIARLQSQPIPQTEEEQTFEE